MNTAGNTFAGLNYFCWTGIVAMSLTLPAIASPSRYSVSQPFRPSVAGDLLDRQGRLLRREIGVPFRAAAANTVSGWTVAANLFTVDDGGDLEFDYSGPAFDAAGDACVAELLPYSSSATPLAVACSQGNSGVWSAPLTLAQVSDALGPTLVSDSKGNMTLLYLAGGSESLIAWRFTAATGWTGPTTVYQGLIGYGGVVTDSAGDVIVLTYTSSVSGSNQIGSLIYRASSGSWSGPVLIGAPSTAQLLNIYASVDGSKIEADWFASGAGIEMAEFDATSLAWKTPTVLPSSSNTLPPTSEIFGNSFYPTAVDPQGNVTLIAVPSKKGRSKRGGGSATAATAVSYAIEAYRRSPTGTWTGPTLLVDYTPSADYSITIYDFATIVADAAGDVLFACATNPPANSKQSVFVYRLPEGATQWQTQIVTSYDSAASQRVAVAVLDSTRAAVTFTGAASVSMSSVYENGGWQTPTTTPFTAGAALDFTFVTDPVNASWVMVLNDYDDGGYRYGIKSAWLLP